MLIQELKKLLIFADISFCIFSTQRMKDKFNEFDPRYHADPTLSESIAITASIAGITFLTCKS